MWLSRYVSIELSDPAPPDVGRGEYSATNGVSVRVQAVAGEREAADRPPGVSTVGWTYETDRLLVAASARVHAGPPDIDAERRLRVPDGPRSRAEAALEEFADLLAVGLQCSRTVRSPMAAAVAMFTDDVSEQAAISGISELAMPRESQRSPTARIIRPRDPSELAGVIGDRLDGAALLADAVSERNPAARARELFRFFERAFTRGSSRLATPLAKFLRSHPRQDALEYSVDEIQHWLTTLRGETIHADTRPNFARSGEVRPYLGRLEVAAYDVLFNKAVWRTEDTARRHGAEILSGVAPRRRGVVLLDPAAEIRITWLDRFDSYPTDFGVKVAVPAGHIWATPGQRDNLDEIRSKGWDLP